MSFDRLHQGPALRVGIPGHGDPAGAVEPVHGVQPGVKQRVAPSKRSNCLADVVSLSPHDPRIAHVRSKTVANIAGGVGDDSGFALFPVIN